MSQSVSVLLIFYVLGFCVATPAVIHASESSLGSKILFTLILTPSSVTACKVSGLKDARTRLLVAFE